MNINLDLGNNIIENDSDEDVHIKTDNNHDNEKFENKLEETKRNILLNAQIPDLKKDFGKID